MQLNTPEYWNAKYTAWGPKGVHPDYFLFQYPLARLPETGAMLEVGGGSGDFLAQVARARPGLELFAFDMCPVAVEQSRARVPQAQYEVGLIPDARPFGGRRFDVVVAIEVVEHHTVEDATVFLACLRAQGERVILTFPRDRNPLPMHLVDYASPEQFEPVLGDEARPTTMEPIPGHWIVEIGRAEPIPEIQEPGKRLR